ncbi:hypothetical protein PsorP6_001535 [Peronosclerospora sorghi]|uniref:Uncharacterized protein n=1 Tax=Peronosclerospora sorghi TaxID=230839 RepID=A0ACC0WVY3_9STRA|nr:hypothetical protein PsorP6_001535 [Peronosclerospora sorghi]
MFVKEIFFLARTARHGVHDTYLENKPMKNRRAASSRDSALTSKNFDDRCNFSVGLNIDLET